LRPRAWRRIHTTMNVTIATAHTQRRPSRASPADARGPVEDPQRHAGGGTDRDGVEHARPYVAQRPAPGPAGAGTRRRCRRWWAASSLSAQSDHVGGEHGAGTYHKLGHPN
jgi:hypothetical protein